MDERASLHTDPGRGLADDAKEGVRGPLLLDNEWTLIKLPKIRGR